MKFLQTGAESQVEQEAQVSADHVMMNLDNQNNYGYIAKFFLGSKGIESEDCDGTLQPIRILLDTGSANSWIISREALKEDYDEETVLKNKGHYSFDPEQSCGNTFTEPEDDKKQHVKITFGSGNL